MQASVTLTDKGAARVRGGLPWVYASDVAQAAGASADLVELRDRRGTSLGTALWSANSPIPVRVLDRGSVTLDEALLGARVAAALERRRRDGFHTDARDGGAARLIHGEADALPGLVVDRYADVLALQTTAPAMDRREAMCAALVARATGARLVVARDDGS